MIFCSELALENKECQQDTEKKMATRTLDHRKEAILKSIVGEYIRTAEPIGSKAIAEREGLGVSPATIRNEMAVLEELGYIGQPHTSAGRIPTDKGYRFYVDSFQDAIELSEEEQKRVMEALANIRKKEIEDIIRGILPMLSYLTCYVSLVLGPPAKRHAYFWGLHQLLHQPEFGDVHKVEYLLELLEHEYRLSELLMEDIGDMQVHVRIGSENKHRELNGMSLVMAQYADDKEPLGTIGILGPTRMDYENAIPMVGFTARRLSRMMSGISD